MIKIILVNHEIRSYIFHVTDGFHSTMHHNQVLVVNDIISSFDKLKNRAKKNIFGVVKVKK